MSLRFDKQLSRANSLAGSLPCVSRSGSAFTLIELLLVIAIIGLLAGLLFPTLARSKARAHSLTCLNNVRQLTYAWTLYSCDNSSRLVYNLGGNINSGSSVAPTNFPNWVNNIMDWTTAQDNTNTAFVYSSLLAPYAGYSAPVYKCPADKALSTAQIQAGFNARVRSVSMNAMVGDPGSLLSGGHNVNNPGYQQFLLDTDIPTPSDIFVMLDEHPDSIDDGYFIDRYSNPEEWVDLPASYHDGGASIAYADGHAALHIWMYATTCPPPVPEGVNLPMAVVPGQTADFSWVLKHMSILSDN